MSNDREIGEISVTVKNIERLLITQNGRIGKAEEDIKTIKWWQAAVAGGGSVIGFFFGVLISIWDKIQQ